MSRYFSLISLICTLRELNLLEINEHWEISKNDLLEQTYSKQYFFFFSLK